MSIANKDETSATTAGTTQQATSQGNTPGAIALDQARAAQTPSAELERDAAGPREGGAAAAHGGSPPAAETQPHTQHQSEMLNASNDDIPAGCTETALPARTDSIQFPPSAKAWRRADSPHTYVSAVHYKQHNQPHAVLIERGAHVEYHDHGRRGEQSRAGGIALLQHWPHAGPTAVRRPRRQHAQQQRQPAREGAMREGI